MYVVLLTPPPPTFRWKVGKIKEIIFISIPCNNLQLPIIGVFKQPPWLSSLSRALLGSFWFPLKVVVWPPPSGCLTGLTKMGSLTCVMIACDFWLWLGHVLRVVGLQKHTRDKRGFWRRDYWLEILNCSRESQTGIQEWISYQVRHPSRAGSSWTERACCLLFEEARGHDSSYTWWGGGARLHLDTCVLKFRYNLAYRRVIIGDIRF